MTPQTIDVTGLSPDAVKAVQTVVALLRGGVPPAGVTPPASVQPDPQADREEWLRWWHAWANSHPKLDGVLDDSRETIYEGRGE